MSIVFSTPIDANRVHLAFNNKVIKFSSNTPNLAPKHCDITATGINVRLYPAPDNSFFFNFKPYIASLINVNNFQDTLSTDLETNDPDSFIASSAGMYISRSVTIAITMSDNSVETTTLNNLKFIAGVEQLGNGGFDNFQTSGLYILSPFYRNDKNKVYLKYWEGYPFDIALLYSPGSLYVKNQSNGLTAQFEVNQIINSYVKRLVFSDGRVDETIENIVPIAEGYNVIRFGKTLAENPTADVYLTLEKVPSTCGVYFKWVNKYGGWSYWLFQSTHAIERSSKSTGSINRDFFNRETSPTRAMELGKESQDTIKVVTDLVTEDERRILEGIFDSPKIYLFTGEPFARAEVNDWIEVTLKTSSARLRNYKQPQINFSLDFELPERYTQTL